jgi:hypothetical protein
VLSGRKIALFDSAGIPKATISFKEELGAFPPAQPTFRIAVSSQLSFSLYNFRLPIYDCRFDLFKSSIGNYQS